MTFSEVLIKRMSGLIETANKDSAWEMEAVAEMMKAVHLLRTFTDAQASPVPGFVKPDTDRQVFFYEQDFYVLSNFSAFRVKWVGIDFDTSEHAYHFLKFRPDFDNGTDDHRRLRGEIMRARSAHEAFKLAEANKHLRRPDWDNVKVETMRNLIRAKADQHEYVRRKLLATGDRELIEDSWRDNYWGWGPKRDGQNMLGKLWMDVRAELRASELPSTQSNSGAPTASRGVGATNATQPAGSPNISDKELAGWARNWHWNDCAEDKPVDPSIYFRDMRMLKAFVEKCRSIEHPSTQRDGAAK